MEHFKQAQQAFGDAAEMFLNDLREHSDSWYGLVSERWKELTSGPGVIDGLKAFAAAVDWTEWWIVGLLVVHVVLLLTIIVLRRRSWVQGGVFAACMLLIYNAERLNSLGAAHWKRFAGQDYFDKQGIFTSALLSAPLLFIMFVVLINYLVSLSLLLVKMKRKELVYRARQQRALGGQQQQQAQQQAQEGKKDK